MNKPLTKYCNNCTKLVYLTEDGYCTECGKHADNMGIAHTNTCLDCGEHHCDCDYYDKATRYLEIDDPLNSNKL